MAKAPPNTPARRDRVRLRGRGDGIGTLTKMDDDTKWCTVEWDGAGPRICHLHELEKAA